MKKLLSFTLLFPALAYGFTDVDDSSPYQEAINHAVENNIVNGYPDNTFRPDQTVNRAEFAKVILQALPNKSIDANCTLENQLTDLNPEQWFYPYVCKLVNDGVIKGYPDATFQAINEINFAEAAKILSLSFYNERIKEIDPWYAAYTSFLTTKMVVPASVNGHEQKLTRGELVEIIYRIQTGENLAFQKDFFIDSILMAQNRQQDVEFLVQRFFKLEGALWGEQSENFRFYLWENLALDKNESFNLSDLDTSEAMPLITKDTNGSHYTDKLTGATSSFYKTGLRKFDPETNDWASTQSEVFEDDQTHYIRIDRDRIFVWPDAYLGQYVKFLSFDARSKADLVLAHSRPFFGVRNLKYFQDRYDANPFLEFSAVEPLGLDAETAYFLGSSQSDFKVDMNAFSRFLETVDVAKVSAFRELSQLDLCETCPDSIMGQVYLDQNRVLKGYQIVVKTELGLMIVYVRLHQETPTDFSFIKQAIENTTLIEIDIEAQRLLDQVVPDVPKSPY